MKITRKDILLAAQTNQIAQLGAYPFGRVVRYAIRFNLQTINSTTFKVLVETIHAEKAAIFNDFGWHHNPGTDQYEMPAGVDNQAAVMQVAVAFLSEEEEVNFRTVKFEDTGDTVFPVSLMPEWMMPMEAVLESAKSNGQASAPITDPVTA